VRADRPIQPLGRGFQAADVISALDTARFAFHGSFRFYHRKALQSSPLRFLAQPLNIIGGITTSDFDASVIAINRLIAGLRGLPELIFQCPLKVINQVFVKAALIAFHRQHMIGLFFYYFGGNLGLASHSIDGHNAAL
jgi:hypothetical protein